MQPADVASVVLTTLTLPRGAELTDVMVRPMLKPDSRVVRPRLISL